MLAPDGSTQIPLAARRSDWWKCFISELLIGRFDWSQSALQPIFFRPIYQLHLRFYVRCLFLQLFHFSFLHFSGDKLTTAPLTDLAESSKQLITWDIYFVAGAINILTILSSIFGSRTKSYRQIKRPGHVATSSRWEGRLKAVAMRFLFRFHSSRGVLTHYRPAIPFGNRYIYFIGSFQFSIVTI